MGFEPGTHVSPASRKSGSRLPRGTRACAVVFPLRREAGQAGLGVLAKRWAGGQSEGELLAQTGAGQLGLRCLGSWSEGLGHVGPIDAMRRTRLLVGEGLHLGPGQGGLGSRAGGWLGWPEASLGWAGLWLARAGCWLGWA